MSQEAIWQRLWLRCQQHKWNSLGLIGSSKANSTALVGIANGMAKLAYDLGQETMVFDATSVNLRDMQNVLARVQSLTTREKKAVVVLSPVSENAITVPIAQSLDAALLGVFLGETSVVSSTRTLDEVGRSKFIGSIILRPNAVV